MNNMNKSKQIIITKPHEIALQSRITALPGNAIKSLRARVRVPGSAFHFALHRSLLPQYGRERVTVADIGDLGVSSE